MGPGGPYPPGAYPPQGPYSPGPYPPQGPYGSPPKKGMPGWGWALVAVGVLVGLAFISIIAITFLGTSASSRFSSVGSQIEGPGFSTGGDDDYGDDPRLDELWDRCADGDGAACDDLYWDSPLGSEYEEFGNTCGGRFSGGDIPFSCESEIGGSGST